MSSLAAYSQQASASRAPAPVSARPATASKYVAIIGFSMTIAAVTAAVASLEWREDPQPAAVATPVALQSAPTWQAPAVAQPAPPPAPAMTEPVAAPLPPQLPAYAPSVAPAQPTQCNIKPLRKFYVAGNGAIRIHASGYVSQVVALGPYPQEVVFPIARPASGIPAPDTVVVEGRAGAVIMTSDFPGFRQVISNLRGTSSFELRWLPLRSC